MFIVEAEMTLLMSAAVTEPKVKARKLHARILTESMFMSAPIFEAEMSMGSMPLLEAEMSLSMPAAVAEPEYEGLAIAEPEGKARKLRAGHA
jgi:hypothetical protein